MIDPAARALLADLRRRYGHRLSVYVAVQTAAALVEGVGILLLFPLLASLGGEGPQWLPRLPLELLLGLFLLAMVVRAALMLVRAKMQAGLTRDYSAALAGDLADALAGMGWPAASDVGQARMQQLWSSNVPRSAVAVNLLLLMAVSVMLLVVQGGIALALSPVMALAAALLLALSSLASLGWVRRSTRQGAAVLEAIGNTAETGFDFHASLKSALAEGRETRFARRYRSLVATEQAALYRVEVAEAQASLANQLAAAAGLAAILYVGLAMVTLEPATLLLLLILFARMMGPARALVSQFQRFLAFAPSFAPLEELVARPPAPVRQPADTPRLDWRTLSFEAIRLPTRGAPSAPVSGRLQRGRWLGLHGPSGAGKSLLVDTLVGLVRPNAGELSLDGQPFDPAATPGWPREIAYLGQDGGVVGASLRALIDAPADTAPARIDALIDAFGLAPLVERVGSLDAPVGDRAARLSGGERQRLALVRAVLRSPSLLILDEATAALDLAAEAEVLGTLRALLPQAAVLMVSHRPQTLARMDETLAIAAPATRDSAL